MARVMLRVFGLMIMAFVVCFTPPEIEAQESLPPYRVTYYEQDQPTLLDRHLLLNNACLEAVILLNPRLDITDVAYGTRIQMPVGEQCYFSFEVSSYSWWNDGNPQRLKYYEHGKWLAEPYYSDEVVYTGGASIGAIAARYNICLDVLLAENILLHDFSLYRAFASSTSMDVFIPKNAPPCDPNWVDPNVRLPSDPSDRSIERRDHDLDPILFVNQYNICAEALRIEPAMGYRYHFPDDDRPCYNDEGQRLLYFDIAGNRLEQPIYSDLPRYLASPGERLADIAERTGSCWLDLMRLNNFPDLPASTVTVELFIPPALPCPSNIEARSIPIQFQYLDEISIELNVCPEELLRLNPRLREEIATGRRISPIYGDFTSERQYLVPADAEPCYNYYRPATGESIYEVEHKLNVCYEEFISHNRRESLRYGRRVAGTINFRRNAQPCYNEAGERLRYAFGEKAYIEPKTRSYSPLTVHIFQRSDTVYQVSRLYNVCVYHLLRINPTLTGSMPTGYPTFIPRTRPCYDEATGMPLIYEDVQGEPLSVPRVGEQLIYYGMQGFERVSSYYNVCVNRITDANQGKLNRQLAYVGWIIPTDRPPCYDEDGYTIDYVCYPQVMDFSIDYTEVNQQIMPDIDGTYCYDLNDPETVVWYDNRPFQIINYDENVMLTSRAFTAWCFGVSLDEINAINEEPAILALLPYHSRAIPLATRECYIEAPDILEAYSRVHVVQAGETLASLAWWYNIPRQMIADANDMDEVGTIWAGQMLIIPELDIGG